MNKTIIPIVSNGTRQNGNLRGEILINLKILNTVRLNYAEEYKKVGTHYLLMLQDADSQTQATIILEEKELRSSRMLSYIFSKYEALVPGFYSYVNSEIGIESVTKQVRSVIIEMAKKTFVEPVRFFGGWSAPDLHGRIYSKPLNNDLREMALNDYLKFNLMVQENVHTQLRCVVPSQFKFSFEKVVAGFSGISDSDARWFLFLFWHYCYMASLFRQYQSSNIVCVEIENPILRQMFRRVFFGQPEMGYCEVEASTTTRQNFSNKFCQAKDIPFVVEERLTAGRNTMRSKIADLQDQIADRSARSIASAVPVIFPNKPMDYPELLHLQFGAENISDDIIQTTSFEFYLYFSQLSSFFAEGYWNDTLEKNYVYYSNKGKPILYAIFATLATVLGDYYSKILGPLEQMLGVEECIEAFLDRYLPKISTIPTMKADAFVEAVRNAVGDERVPIYSRLEENRKKCVRKQTLETEACILVATDGWALNDLAFKKILDVLPHAPSRREALRILDQAGVLSETRINRDSYQNKLRVHTFEDDTVIHTFVVLRADLFAVEKEEAEEELLPDHRYFFLGKRAGTERPIYWDFDDADNANRHVLITGKSGTGKSYLLQKLIRQAASNQITTVIFHNQGELPEVPNRIVIDVAEDRPSIGASSEIDFFDAQKIATLLKQTLRLRDTQTNTVRQCYAEYLKRFSEGRSLFHFFEQFSEIAMSMGKRFWSVQAKVEEILDSRVLSGEPIYWENYAGSTLILDFRGCSDYANLFQMQTELFLRDLYYYKKRNPSSPMIAIVDEFQKLNTGDDSALATIIREGRKYGWSLWMASQLLENGNSTQLKRLSGQASTQLYFSQGAKGNRSISNTLGLTSTQKNQIFEDLQGLGVGQFLVAQDGKTIQKCDGKDEP